MLAWVKTVVQFIFCKHYDTIPAQEIHIKYAFEGIVELSERVIGRLDLPGHNTGNGILTYTSYLCKPFLAIHIFVLDKPVKRNGEILIS